LGKGAAMTQHQRVDASPARTAFLVGVPLVWVVVALLHPQGDGDVFDYLDDKVGLWLGVHFAQPVLALGVAAVLWMLLAGRTSTVRACSSAAVNPCRPPNCKRSDRARTADARPAAAWYGSSRRARRARRGHYGQCATSSASPSDACGEGFPPPSNFSAACRTCSRVPGWSRCASAPTSPSRPWPAGA
jgi:hypothetical protein